MARPRLLNIALRWFPLLVLGMLIPAFITLAITSVQPHVYQSSATMLPAQLKLAGNPDVDTVAISRLIGLSTNYAFKAKSNEMLTTTARKLNLTESTEVLAKRVDAEVDGNSAALKITARAGTAAGAAALANAIAKEIEVQSATTQLDASQLATLENIRSRLLEAESEYRRLLALPAPLSQQDLQSLVNSLTLVRELTTVYDSLGGSGNKTPGGLEVVVPADPLVAIQIEPRMIYYTLLAAVAGLLLAAGIASLLEYLDDTVKSAEDVAEVADLRTLGTIAWPGGRRGRIATNGLATLRHPQSGVAEAYRTLRAGIDFASVDMPIHTLLVTSSDPGEGKSITAANLAIAFAQTGRRVLLVDADLRNPSVHTLFDVSNAVGLTTLLWSDKADLDDVATPTEQLNLRILTTGTLPPNPAEVLGAQRMRIVIDRLKAVGDLVILDGASLDTVTDSLILSSFLDGTVLVISTGRSRRGAVKVARDALARAHATVIGAVLYGTTRGKFPKDGRDSKAPREKPVMATRAGERRTIT